MARRCLLAAAALLALAQLALALPARESRGLLAAGDACMFLEDKCVPSPAAVVAGKAPANDHDK
jgi:hypothetical protein